MLVLVAYFIIALSIFLYLFSICLKKEEERLPFMWHPDADSQIPTSWDDYVALKQKEHEVLTYEELGADRASHYEVQDDENEVEFTSDNADYKPLCKERADNTRG